MTALDDLRARLRSYRCDVKLAPDGKVKLVEYGAFSPTPDLVAEARKLKPALKVELLREQAWNLVAFIDGDAPLAERQVKLPKLLAVEDRLSTAQEALWASWRRAGFTILWSSIVEEFILVGDAPPPPGSESMAVYTWAEIAALKDAAPERVIAAHKVKKAFAGTIRAPR